MSAQEAEDGGEDDREVHTRTLVPNSGANSANLNIPSDVVDKLVGTAGGGREVAIVVRSDGVVCLVPLEDLIGPCLD